MPALRYSRHTTISSPVVSQMDMKYATAPVSVALPSRISPPATPFIALRASSTGSGHLRPVASREVTDKPAIPLFEGVAGPTNSGAPQKNPVHLDPRLPRSTIVPMPYGSLLLTAGRASRLLKAMGNEGRQVVLCYLSRTEEHKAEIQAQM